jgi:hypothetical protein
MRFQFIRLFFDANPTPGGGNPPTPTPAPQPNPQPAPEPKPDAAMQAKIEALEKEIAELKKPKPEPTPNPQPTPGKEPEVPEYVKKQNELIEKLVNTVTTLQTEKVVTTRRTVLETELKGVEGLSDAYRDEVIDNFNGRSFKDDAEFETFKKAKVEAAKKLAQTEAANSISIFTAPGKSAGGNGNKMSPAMENYLKSKQPAAAAKN